MVNAQDAMDVNLKEKRKIKELKMEWGSGRTFPSWIGNRSCISKITETAHCYHLLGDCPRSNTCAFKGWAE